MSLNLDKLVKQRDAVLLGEISALIHDLGKLSQEFVELNALDGLRLSFAHHLILRRVVSEYHEISTISSIEIQQVKEWLQKRVAKLSPEELADRDTKGNLLNQYNERFTELNRDGRRQLFEELLIDEHFLPVCLTTLLNMLSIPFDLPGEEILLGDVLEHHDTPLCTVHKEPVELLAARFDGCDGVDSAVDKGTAKDRQLLQKTYIATAFGSEPENLRIRTDKLKKVRHDYAEALATTLTQIQTARAALKPGQQLDPREWERWLYGDKGLRDHTRDAFLKALGETRRAANDVTLWDHSYSVASLYKAALARVILAGSVKPKDLEWRLLYVTFDGLGFISKAHRIGDVLGRQEALEQAMDAIRDLIEVEVPLGNEVYRDENGIAFILPELPNETDRKALAEFLRVGGKVNVDNQERDIAGIETRFLERTEGELVPSCRFWENTVPSKIARDADKVRKWKLQQLGELIRPAPPWPQVTPEAISKVSGAWQNPPPDAELCPVCRLGPKHDADRACHICEDRRQRRARDWLSNLHTTIWIDEVSDVNGGVALVTGAFQLTDWLNGDFVETMMTVADPEARDPDKRFVPKHPSPARLHRVWTTTRDFWQSLVDAEMAEDRRTGRRWAFTVQGLRLEPGKYLQWGNYDVRLTDRLTFKFSLFHDNGRLLLIENPAYLAKQLDCAPEEVSNELVRHQIELFKPSERLERGDKVATLRLVPDKAEPIHYAPFIHILITPRRFLAVVPANEAFAQLEHIRDKYEIEMGRVRNRLPLTLAVVFFDRHAPLAAAMEAAQRMLVMPDEPKVWRVVHAHDRDSRLMDVQGEPVQVCLQLQTGDDEVIDVCLGIACGDGRPDFFYPYWRLAANRLPAGRTYSYVLQHNGQSWPLVHAAELRKGDEVHFAPSRFDFEYLDVAGRRYEVAYEGNGRRRGRPSRPYLLENLRRFQQVWNLLTGPGMLTAAQIEALSAVIETRRDQGWQTADSVSFKQFVRDTLANAGDGWWGKLASGEKRLLEDWAIRGRLTDVLEWFMSIMKEKPAHDRQT